MNTGALWKESGHAKTTRIRPGLQELVGRHIRSHGWAHMAERGHLRWKGITQSRPRKTGDQGRHGKAGRGRRVGGRVTNK